MSSFSGLDAWVCFSSASWGAMNSIPEPARGSCLTSCKGAPLCPFSDIQCCLSSVVDISGCCFFSSASFEEDAGRGEVVEGTADTGDAGSSVDSLLLIDRSGDNSGMRGAGSGVSAAAVLFKGAEEAMIETKER